MNGWQAGPPPDDHTSFPVDLTDDLVPLRRPHFQLRDGRLYFLVSRRPHAELDPVDAGLWDRFDGRTTLGRLRATVPDLDGRIRKFWSLGAIELAPEIFKTGRRRILVVEPHMDDAVLSVGGVMWQQRQECEFTVLSVVGVSNFTSYHRMDREYFDIGTVTALRRAESGTVMRLLGGHHRVLDVHDAPLRYQPGKWTREWYVRHRRSISAFINRSPRDTEVEALTARLVAEFAAADLSEIWIPLGVGTSTDHETTRNACLGALLRSPGLVGKVRLFFYQDVPYARQFPWHTEQIVEALTAAGGTLELVCDDIGDAMPAKLRLLEIFGSQFKPSYMEPRVIATAHQAAGSSERLAEIRYEIKKLPGQLDPFALYSGSEPVRTALGRLEHWYPRHRHARRIRILCPLGIGRWEEDMAALLAAFPDAIFEVHLTADATAETARFASPRIEVRPVQGLKGAWLLRILRVVLSRPDPLIVLTSVKLRPLHPLIRIAFFFSSPLPATTMDHLAQSLHRLPSDHL